MPKLRQVSEVGAAKLSFNMIPLQGPRIESWPQAFSHGKGISLNGLLALLHPVLTLRQPSELDLPLRLIPGANQSWHSAGAPKGLKRAKDLQYLTLCEKHCRPTVTIFLTRSISCKWWDSTKGDGFWQTILAQLAVTVGLSAGNIAIHSVKACQDGRRGHNSDWYTQSDMQINIGIYLDRHMHIYVGSSKQTLSLKHVYRRKFGSQTSDNMDRWNRRGGKSQRRKEEERRPEKRKSPKMQVCEREKSCETLFFQCLAQPKLESRLAKMRYEQLHAYVARTRFRSQRGQTTWASECFWHWRCRQSARSCDANHAWKSKRTKRLRFCAFRSWDDQKCSLLRREAHFEFKLHKASNVRITFARWSVADRGRCNGFCIVSKMNNGGHGVFEESLQRWISRGRRNTRDISIRHVKRSGPDFLRRVAFWSIRSSGLLRWFCVTGAALRMTWLHFFMANAIAR